MDGLHPDAGRRYRIKDNSAEADICDTKEDLGQTAKEVKIAFPMSDKIFQSPRSTYNEGV